MRGQNPKKQLQNNQDSSFHLGKSWVEAVKACLNGLYLHQGRVLRFEVDGSN
jgi:hypothetical protein